MDLHQTLWQGEALTELTPQKQTIQTFTVITPGSGKRVTAQEKVAARKDAKAYWKKAVAAEAKAL